MSYRVSLHPLAKADLRQIAAWVARFAGLAAAERRFNEFDHVRRGLAKVPHRGSIRDDVASGVRAIPAGESLVVAFIVDDTASEVVVLVVSHGGSDLMGRARQRA